MSCLLRPGSVSPRRRLNVSQEEWQGHPRGFVNAAGIRLDPPRKAAQENCAVLILAMPPISCEVVERRVSLNRAGNNSKFSLERPIRSGLIILDAGSSNMGMANGR